MKCWTCGEQMDPDTWKMAPREPSDADLRMCRLCHTTLDALPNPLRVANMIRYAARIRRVPPMPPGYEDRTPPPPLGSPEAKALEERTRRFG